MIYDEKKDEEQDINGNSFTKTIKISFPYGDLEKMNLDVKRRIESYLSRRKKLRNPHLLSVLHPENRFINRINNRTDIFTLFYITFHLPYYI